MQCCYILFLVLLYYPLHISPPLMSTMHWVLQECESRAVRNAGIPCASHLSGFHIELRKDKMVYFGIFQNTKTPGGIGCRIYQHISGIRASGIRHNSTITKWFIDLMQTPIVTASISRLSQKCPSGILENESICIQEHYWPKRPLIWTTLHQGPLRIV